MTHTNRSRTLRRLPGVPKHLNITLKGAFMHPSNHIRAYGSYLNRNSAYKHLPKLFRLYRTFFLAYLTAYIHLNITLESVFMHLSNHIRACRSYLNRISAYKHLPKFFRCIYSQIFVTNIRENTQNWYSHSYEYGHLWYSRIQICVIRE